MRTRIFVQVEPSHWQAGRMKPIDRLPSPVHYPKRCPLCLLTLLLMRIGWAQLAPETSENADG